MAVDHMGVLWTQNNWQTRVKRLAVKIGESPFLPLVAWGKVLEALFLDVPLVPALVAAVVCSAWFVIAEDFSEYASQEYDRLTDVWGDD